MRTSSVVVLASPIRTSVRLNVAVAKGLSWADTLPAGRREHSARGEHGEQVAVGHD